VDGVVKTEKQKSEKTMAPTCAVGRILWHEDPRRPTMSAFLALTPPMKTPATSWAGRLDEEETIRALHRQP
jgi:hypothetical protein